MKTVTYNLQFNGAGRQDWSHVLGTFDPDIFLVQESLAPPSHLQQQAVWSAINPPNWGSAVYVKCGKVAPMALGAFQGWLAGAEVEAFPHPGQAGRRLRVFSLHAPPRTVTGEEYPETVNKMLDVIMANQGDTDLVIGGDFNLLSLGERHHSERQPDGTPWVTTLQEQDILARLRREFGLINCWQTANPGVPLAQTLRLANEPRPAHCPRCPPVRSIHCDGIFVPASWGTAPFCTVVNNEEWTGRNDGLHLPRSDHNPVVATFTKGGWG